MGGSGDKGITEQNIQYLMIGCFALFPSLGLKRRHHQTGICVFNESLYY
jgi:hypothetical protein